MTSRTSVAVAVVALLGMILPAAAQNNGPKTSKKAGQKLEALLQTAEIPFTKSGDSRYVVVITVEKDSDRFQITLEPLGDDANKEEAYLIQMYFTLGVMPEGAQLSGALARQIVTWNSNLSVAKVVKIDNVIFLNTTSWLVKTDADLLALNAVLGHMIAKDIRKELAPYLKQ